MKGNERLQSSTNVIAIVMQDKRRHIRNIESKEPKVIWSLIEKKKRSCEESQILQE